MCHKLPRPMIVDARRPGLHLTGALLAATVGPHALCLNDRFGGKMSEQALGGPGRSPVPARASVYMPHEAPSSTAQE